ncbi:MAG TPA: pilus assembly protein CpaE [Rhodobacteraceae bacterium]|nr:pilus assembly protein CpaE [Paracoccaceae bacterium]
MDRKMEAFAVASSPESFELLSGELHGLFGQNWGNMTVLAAGEMLGRGAMAGDENLIVCVEAQDEQNLEPIDSFVREAKKAGFTVVLVAKDVSPTALHRLLQLGADDFAPYPLPDHALSNIFDRLRDKKTAPADSERRKSRSGVILPVYGAAGGVGASTFAVNLAWEMATATRKDDMRVALIDLDLQFGSVATLLDIPRREAVFDLLTEPDTLAGDTLAQAMTSYKSVLAVLTSPPEVMPLDIMTPEYVERMLRILQSRYDFIVVDLPKALTDWSASVLTSAETYFSLLELDMRSAQNLMRYLRVLRGEDLPGEKIQYILNRAPGFADLNGKTRVGRFSESLGIEVNILLPDGGKAVTQAGDQGEPLANSAPKNPLRKEIKKIAGTLINLTKEARAAVVD